jgi:glyoxylate reductase
MTEVEAALGVTYVDMDALLAESDFVTLHINLTKATYHLIGQEALGKMKPTAVLINAARGGVVDSEALYKALRDGEIAYAALDVTEPEPIPDDAPSPITLLTR